MTSWKIQVRFVCLTAILSACSSQDLEQEPTESSSLALGPGPATPLSPSGTTISLPSYSWTEVAGATSYRLWVNDTAASPKVNEVVAASTACLGGGTCNFTPATTLAPGGGKWWVQAISSEPGPWSAAMSISVAGGSTLIAPTGTTTQTPTFQWTAAGAGASFQLYVNDTSGSAVINQTLSAAAVGCNGSTGTCSYPSPITLASGPAKWWLRVNGGSWQGPIAFTVLGIPAPVSPSGAISTATPTFQWTSVPGAAGYQLWVNDAATSAVINQTYTPAQAGCSGGGTCQVSPGVSLASGPGKFWVKLSTSTIWSSAMSFNITGCSSCTGPTTRVSVGSGGAQSPFGGSWPAISSDGRYVAFVTGSALTAGDSNATGDVFVHDRTTNQTTLVSVATDGTQGDAFSTSPSMSGDGRYVAFYSQSTTLVAGDSNFDYDVFVRDRNTNQTTRVSVASDGTEGTGTSWAPAISADGRYVAFSSSAPNLVALDTNNARDVFVHDQTLGLTTRISEGPGGQGDGESDSPSISADGRYVAFYSGSTNLVLGDTNGTADVFVYDRNTGQTTRVSVTSGGVQGNGQSLNPSISANGDSVAFYSDSTNLVAGDTNSVDDVFLHVRGAGHTSRISVATDGTEGNSYSYWPSISADGLSVVYRSEATNLVSGDVNGVDDIFVRRISTASTSLVSLAWNGAQGNNASYLGVLSADGSLAVFTSDASNLVFGDTNGGEDCFARLLP